jgi:hypothetical protein
VSDHPAHQASVHQLPAAPNFVGREAELESLRALWNAGFHGVVALVGLGGAGKTALAARFVEEVLGPATDRRPAGAFVWSFYQEPDGGMFLQEAYRYFARQQTPTAPAKGAALLQLLEEAFRQAGPYVLVLDGLEKVQRQEGAEPGAYGQIEDPLLKALLTRAAKRESAMAVVVTSRFPLTDLEQFRDRGYRTLDVGGLGREAAVGLLRLHGVQGDDPALVRLVEAFGAHALTVDHLGSLLGRFLGGDPARAPEVPALAPPGTDRQALRLARLLRAYEEHLPPAELTLLCQLCLLRRGVSAEQIQRLFLCVPAVRISTARGLADLIERFPAWNYPADGLADLAEAVQGAIEEALCTATLGGPAESFRQEVCLAIDEALARDEADAETDYDGLARLYAGKWSEAPKDDLPLSMPDRDALRQIYARYTELRHDPLLPWASPPPLLEMAFKDMGMLNKPAVGRGEGPTSADVLQSFVRMGQRLRHLCVKHIALRQVCRLCRSYQRKSSLAGPLSALDAAGLHRVLEALVRCHLVLREAGGAYSVHPAVRDHFSRLAMLPDSVAWHDLIREQLLTLVQRPGRPLAADSATLDLVEEAIYHTLQAGRAEEAFGLYRDILGGLRHLAWKLGEVARGLRILREFKPCPDPWALGWYLRALGELDEAYRQNALPYFRADVRLLQGRLPEVAAEVDSARAAVAAFLMGTTSDLPPNFLGHAVPRTQLLIYLGRLDQARRSAGLERLYQEIGQEGERSRCHLLLAEVARRQADPALALQHLEAAARWILHSGSCEHLCQLHLIRARLARSTGDAEAARRDTEEGLHLAERADLGLYRIELLCERAEECLARGEGAPAERPAREALRHATAANCRFRWGAAEAGHLLGQALFSQGRVAEARHVLDEALRVRRELHDPRADQTARLVRLLPA